MKLICIIRLHKLEEAHDASAQTRGSGLIVVEARDCGPQIKSFY